MTRHDPDRGPARPEQNEREGYGRGLEDPVDTPDEDLPPNFARGQAPEHVPQERHRFSEGQEHEPEHTPDKDREGRFSEGQDDRG